jgi:hypothetical protein
VTDSRGLLGSSWAALASTTSFSTGGGTAAETVHAANVAYLGVSPKFFRVVARGLGHESDCCSQ